MIEGKYLLLGTNLGKREINLSKALKLLEKKGISVVRQSTVYESTAWGYENQPDFLNLVTEVNTKKEPHDLLQTCLHIEKEMGRVRYEKWHERLIDIDILYYEQEVINEPNLVIPHPEIVNRRFTLMPLAELIPDAISPNDSYSIKQLLETTSDKGDCWKTNISLYDLA